jgi:hypothetical protein
LKGRDGMSESSSCTNGYINNNIVRGWNGFIAPNGIFYPVSKKDAEMMFDDESVQKYASEILNINSDLQNDYRIIQFANPEYRNKQLSNIQILVYIKGYVVYNHSKGSLQVLHPTFPNSKIANTCVTPEQFLAGIELANKNNDNIDDYCNCFNINSNVTTMEVKQKVYSA